jgi:hypothetical protein
MAEPKTGVITTKARNISKTVIVIKGNKIRLFLKPGIVNVRFVARRFTIEIVVLMNAQPATVCVALEHLTTYLF